MNWENRVASRVLLGSQDAELWGVIRRRIPVWKRLLDFAILLVCAPVLVTVFGLIAVFIKLVSRGPVLDGEMRIGYGGRVFKCLKFRTKRTPARRRKSSFLPKAGEAEIPGGGMNSGLIPCGQLLHSSGLDELAQLINVLRGEMSIVGPRPCTMSEFMSCTVFMRRRFSVLPGMTGLWQLSDKDQTTFEEMGGLDVKYTENAALGLDLRIIARTCLRTLRRTSSFTKKDGNHVTKRTSLGSRTIRNVVSSKRETK